MKKQKGFTLIEILVVIAIIGILATIVLVSLQETKNKGRIARAQSDIRSIRTALVILEDNSVEWPGHWKVDIVDSGAGGNEVWDLGSTAGGIVQTDGSFPNWKGPYINGNFPKDPWGNDYFFDPDYDLNPSGTSRWSVVIGSFGPNGVGQNVFDSDNIIEIMAIE